MNAPAAAAPGLSARLIFTIFLPLVSGYFISFFFRYVNAVISGELVRDFALTPAQLALQSSAYYLAFGIAQLPLGLALDRFGPRRVVGTLMLVTALGAAGFALAGGLATLSISRALIGLGVSGCLMGALKAFRAWLPTNRLATATSLYVMVGGLGALAATAPAQMLLGPIGWRGIFLGAAVASLVVSAATFAVIPESQHGRSNDGLRALLTGTRAIYGDGRFWRIVIPYVAAYSAYGALQGLWFGPYLRDVEGLSPAAAANLLFFGILSHFVAGGFVGPTADRLAGRGIPLSRFFAAGCVLSLALLVALAFAPAGSRTPLVIVYAMSLTLCSLGMSMLGGMYPAELAGRVNTAHNMLQFLSVFVAQSAFGIVLGLYPAPDGHYSPEGYRTALLFFAGLQAFSLACLLPHRR